MNTLFSRGFLAVLLADAGGILVGIAICHDGFPWYWWLSFPLLIGAGILSR